MDSFMKKKGYVYKRPLPRAGEAFWFEVRSKITADAVSPQGHRDYDRERRWRGRIAACQSAAAQNRE